MAVGLGSGEQPLMVWFYYNSVSVLQDKAFLCLSLAGCYLKISLKISMKMRRGPYTLDLNEAQCWFSTKWDVL